METRKAHARRVKEGFFDRYLLGSGIDIGVGRVEHAGDGEDKVTPECRGWDKDDGDATFMAGVQNATYDWVHASHVLEHISNPWKALRNWFRILKPGGCLALLLPHRDLYEQRKELPSLWNQDHKHFYMPFFHELPDTLGLAQLAAEALQGRDYRVLYVKECSDGYDWSLRGKGHAVGEYSIEAVVLKL